MKVYVIVKKTLFLNFETYYWTHENVKAFASKQDALFDLKYVYRPKCSCDCDYSIEEMELL